MIPSGVTTQIITGLSPNAGYTVSSITSGTTTTVSIAPGGSLLADAGGVLVINSVGAREATKSEPLLVIQAFPNPAQDLTTIRYELPTSAVVQLDIVDVLGRKVAVLVDNQVQEAGSHQVTLQTKLLGKGVYVCKLSANGQQVSSRILVH